MTSAKRLHLLIFLALWLGGITVPVAVSSPKTSPIPMLAYYYIWYDTKSWDRAKTDYPLLGRYSSDDRAIMEEHVRLAKAAGLDGFIVSWKSTYTLDLRLEQLINVATAEDFKLWIIYQGLDFDRQPLPVERIINDLEYFVDAYADYQPFAMYDLPVVILSGTWEFSADEIRAIHDNFDDRLYVLGSERNVQGYLRLANSVDGNAYYWSSVDPQTDIGYADKLSEMGMMVHAHLGIWVAPAAPGFDARLIGGTRVIDRRNGQTLRDELSVAIRSNPDVIGLISWNEFSENTHIEPSEKYGSMALDVLMNRQTSRPSNVTNFDSSAEGAENGRRVSQPVTLFGIFLLTVLSLSVVLLRKNTAENISGT